MGATRSVHSGSCNLKWICVSDACQLISVSDSYLLKGPKQQKRDTINSIRGHGSKATQVMNSDLIGGPPVPRTVYIYCAAPNLHHKAKAAVGNMYRLTFN